MLSLEDIDSKNNVAQLYKKERVRRLLDAGVVILIVTIAVVLGGVYDLYERWHVFVMAHEDWELDETVLGVTSFTLLMIWYAWRRQRYAEEIKEIALNLADDANKASQAKSQFLASMSHDLRTPLNAIIGFSDVMREELFGPVGCDYYKQYVEDIHYSGSLLTELINDILDLSKVEAGKFELASEQINISEVVNASFRQLEAMAQSFDHKVSVNIPQSMPFLLGDRRVLVQIMNNLLSNSIKFTPRGGRIKICCDVDAGGRVVIRVEDSGVGMSNEDLQAAFKPFENSNALVAREYKGSGLGVYLCASFMKQLGGSLEIESAIEHGTTATLIFPADRTLKNS